MRRLPKKIIALITAGAIVLLLAFICIGMQIAFVKADKIKCWRPEYERTDIGAILDKPELTAFDYAELYRQTGLTKLGVDRTLKTYGKDRVLRIQDDFFTEHEVKNDFFAPFVCTDFIDEHITYAALENGDIIVTSSTHLSGWRMGHAGLVTEAATQSVLQASAIGSSSAIGSIRDFTDRVNFMIFSPVADEETKAQVVDYAVNNLTGIVYDPTAGVFSKKNSLTKTQCAHLVWYAYNYFGMDLDSNGRLVVTPRDLANSPQMQLVQVFGFNPFTLWR